MIFKPRKAWWYLLRGTLGWGEKGSQGASYYTAKNPDFGATFTYFLKEDYKTKQALRKEEEKAAKKNGQGVKFPGWDALEEEENQHKPKVWLTVKDKEGNVIRKLKGVTKKGYHRTSWNLRYPSNYPVRLTDKEAKDGQGPNGAMVGPGTYTVTLTKEIDGQVTQLAGPVEFEVERLREGTLPSASPEAVAKYWKEMHDFNRNRSATNVELSIAIKRVQAMELALSRTTAEPGKLDKDLHDLHMELLAIERMLEGNKVKERIGEKNNPSYNNRIWEAYGGNSTYGPTAMQKRQFEIVKEEYVSALSKFSELMNTRMPALEQRLREAGAPWVE
ncbi:MAG: hypothetical protein HKN92_11730 [Chitinophagales bacterium]|nr:hypothetical protein [Chitinophagales bacterium]